jgi:hypothetical protein
MIGFIGISVTSSLNHTQLQCYCYSTHFQFTIPHALGFLVSTGCLLATDLNTETITSNQNEVFLSLLLQSICTHNSLTPPNCTALVPIRFSTANRLLISLYYNTLKVFKSHVKSSHRSTSQLLLLACYAHSSSIWLTDESPWTVSTASHICSAQTTEKTVSIVTSAWRGGGDV